MWLERAGDKDDRVDIVKIIGNIAMAKIDSERSGWLVYTDAFHPDWIALIDGRLVDVERANVGLKAIQTPAGEHVVWFEFRPRILNLSFLLGAFIFALLGNQHLISRRSKSSSH